MRAGAGVHGVEQRHRQVLGDAEAREWPRQLKAARQATAGALVCGQAVHGGAVETHGAHLVGERAADAVDQRRLAGAVRTNEAEPLASLHRKVDAVERHEAAEALTDIVDLEERGHGVLRATASRGRRTRPATRQIASTSAKISQDAVGKMLIAAPAMGRPTSHGKPMRRPRANARKISAAQKMISSGRAASAS